MKEGCFSGAVSSEEDQYFSCRYSQVEIDQRREASEALGDTSSLERRAQCLPPFGRRAWSSRFEGVGTKAARRPYTKAAAIRVTMTHF